MARVIRAWECYLRRYEARQTPSPGAPDPSEQEVLSHLREGLTNEQIARRLGISRFGVKYHVSEILSKLGVSSRDKAAAWQGEALGPRSGRLRGFGAVVVGPFERLTGVSALKLAGGSAIGVAGVFLVLLALGVLAMNGREPETPDLGKIVYVSGGDIWVKALPDGAPLRLTSDGRNHAPRWSPSGEGLLFEKPVERAPAELWVMRADGSDARQVEAEAYRQMSYHWAPGDDILAYINPKARAVVVERADGSERELLLSAPDRGWSAIGGFMHWSPDGAWLAVTATALGDQPFPVAYVAIWAIRADGSEARELLAYRDARAGLLVAGWTPDSSKVIYSLNPSFSASYISDGLQWEVVSLDPNVDDPEPSSEIEPPKMVLPYKDFRDVAPDGRVVAVRGGYRYVTERKAIALVDFTNGVSFNDLTPAGRAATSPALAPDGSAIAFTMQPEDTTGNLTSVENKRIWLMNVDGSALRRLNNVESRQERPQWSRDGRYILFVQPAAAAFEAPNEVTLWLHDLADGFEREILRLNLAGVPDSTPSIGYYGHIDWDQLFDWWQP